MIAFMVASMTAFSRQSSQGNWGEFTWELRSVNHRYLEISIRLPESLRSLEPMVREALSKKLHRGKVDASLRYALTAEVSPPSLNLNESVVKQLADAGATVRKHFPDAQTDLLALLAWPGVLEPSTIAQETLSQAALRLLVSTLEDLVAMRQREGLQIKTFIQQRLSAILAAIAQVEASLPQLLAAEKERIALKIAELNLESSGQRLEQEMALLLQKTDIAEEIQRLNSHCQAMTAALSQAGAVGRRLDFLSQELHREANTLSSKALAVSLTHASVEMRVFIEQIREQVQNIE